eukprot:CAMPEP_0202114596 /NCGR_PEP_ID=MMETSP0965-20130614/36646_1 /ASSEMBLY_ACC=CAM_ASM_000507 /TAXON_ID=4773 /ORGANISM="Schizochytrium aggregatum, Strain ATCC28209" /LENGTH=186 /DNA_ID=CAMNT_0048684327 /DNA_START=448 /DNA_END=1005 /DNA_ORIENTATION=+
MPPTRSGLADSGWVELAAGDETPIGTQRRAERLKWQIVGERVGSRTHDWILATDRLDARPERAEAVKVGQQVHHNRANRSSSHDHGDHQRRGIKSRRQRDLRATILIDELLRNAHEDKAGDERPDSDNVVEQEHSKVCLVPGPDAVAHNAAVVVKLSNAGVTVGAVVSGVVLSDVAHAAKPPRRLL